jgi:hypothetical protein
MFVLLNELTSFISGDTKWQSRKNGDNSLKAFTGSRVKAPLILNLGACDVAEWSTSHFGRFTPAKELGYLSNRILGASQSRSGRSEEGREHFPPPGLEIRTVQPVEVATLTALFH